MREPGPSRSSSTSAAVRAAAAALALLVPGLTHVADGGPGAPVAPASPTEVAHPATDGGTPAGGGAARTEASATAAVIGDPSTPSPAAGAGAGDSAPSLPARAAAAGDFATPAEAARAAGAGDSAPPAPAGAAGAGDSAPSPSIRGAAVGDSAPPAPAVRRVAVGGSATPAPAAPAAALGQSARSAAAHPAPAAALAPPSDAPAAGVATAEPPGEPAPPHGAVSERQRPEIVIKTILALLGLVALAYLGGHPRVQEWEAKLRISQVITAGFPFVVLGVLAQQPGVGIVTEPVLAEMETLLGIALGWIGLVAGFRFDARLMGGLPAGAARAVALATSIPFAFVAGLTGFALLSLCGGLGPSLRDPTFLRDALILGTAGAMTAKSSARLLRTAEPASTLARVIRVEELAGIAGLAIVSAYFRPHADVTWQLPGTAWLLLAIGLGATVGIVTCAILESAEHSRPEFVVLALGSVSFAAGLAGHLHLSPIVITFIAGAFLANFPGRYNARLGSALRRLERPVYLLSLFAIGALWDVRDWRGWVLMPLFMAARLIGKRVAANAVARGTDLRLGEEEREALAVAPMGPLAIAIVVNAQLLYPGGSVSLIASAVVGGAILTEVVVQLVRHGKLETVERRSGAPKRRASGALSAPFAVPLPPPDLVAAPAPVAAPAAASRPDDSREATG